jgi:hypothetical protein
MVNDFFMRSNLLLFSYEIYDTKLLWDISYKIQAYQ